MEPLSIVGFLAFLGVLVLGMNHINQSVFSEKNWHTTAVFFSNFGACFFVLVVLNLIKTMFFLSTEERLEIGYGAAAHVAFLIIFSMLTAIFCAGYTAWLYRVSR